MGVAQRTEPRPAIEPRFPEAPPPPSGPTTAATSSATMAELLPTRTPRVEPLPAPAFASTPWEEAPSPGPTPTAPATPDEAGTLADVAPVPEVIEVRARPAALWQRITAFIVDGTLVGAVLAVYVGLAAALIAPHGVPATQLGGIDGVMARVHQLHAVLAPCVALALVLGLVYTAAFALLWDGRTPGRRLLGIRLVDRTGMAPAPGRAIARAVLALVSFVPFLAGFWLALFDRRGQTLHDKLTQTFVVRPG